MQIFFSWTLYTTIFSMVTLAWLSNNNIPLLTIGRSASYYRNGHDPIEPVMTRPWPRWACHDAAMTSLSLSWRGHDPIEPVMIRPWPLWACHDAAMTPLSLSWRGYDPAEPVMTQQPTAGCATRLSGRLVTKSFISDSSWKSLQKPTIVDHTLYLFENHLHHHEPSGTVPPSDREPSGTVPPSHHEPSGTCSSVRTNTSPWCSICFYLTINMFLL